MVNVRVKRAVGYVRVSSEGQIDNTSIGEQMEKIKLYCQLHNIELVKIFTDEGETGSKVDKRKGYNDMIGYIQNNNIDAIIVNKIDRIHRSGKNLLIMVEDILEPLNIAFISITEQFDTSSPQGKLFLTMLGGFAEFERSTINARTKSGRVATAKKGKFAGGKVPFGYVLIDSEKLILEIDKKKADIVKSIFKMRADKYSLQRIANELNNEDILKDGKKWAKTSIDYILKNRAYVGEYEYNGKKENNGIKYSIPKIISKQLWNKIH
ncbi:recombinase family protein [Clostridium sp. MB40-C1]|uniref:recombinase family protein n=1 Tax=Clostridium sp. MB40-C1 TaxID=3070996 RepID=UPI0027E172BC|nr:recombinase family protein [Clostridium sp. MB40-C1]WMJ81256.1 recombinase family protein [Clostridium sp. MB40-C1]